VARLLNHVIGLAYGGEENRAREPDFTDLAFVDNTMVFDLLRSGSVDGISGDFTSFLFTGLQNGYSVIAGVELDGVEIYRVRVAPQSVTEPGTLSLLLSCLVVALMSRALPVRRLESRQ
jgi:hypothetical protein